MDSNCSSAASRLPTISWASTSGSGRFLRIFQGFILQPEDIQADLVALHDFIVTENTEALGFHPLVTVLQVEALDEIRKVRFPHRIGLQREMQIGAQIVILDLIRPGLFTTRAEFKIHFG